MDTAHPNCCILTRPHCVTAIHWLGLLGLWQLKDLAWYYVTYCGKCRVRRNRKISASSLHFVGVMREQPSDTGGWEDQERNQYLFVSRKYVPVKWTLITNQLSLLLDCVLGVFLFGWFVFFFNLTFLHSLVTTDRTEHDFPFLLSFHSHFRSCLFERCCPSEIAICLVQFSVMFKSSFILQRLAERSARSLFQAVA